MVASLFPLGITPEGSTLTKIAGGVIWVGALLSVLLSLDSLFKSDQRDGSLEQLLLSPYPLPVLVLAKVLAHWLRTGFCLTLMSPLLGLMLYLPGDAIWALLFSLILGTPLLSLAGAISAALTVRIQQGGVLMTLISPAPLYTRIDLWHRQCPGCNGWIALYRTFTVVDCVSFFGCVPGATGNSRSTQSSE